MRTKSWLNTALILTLIWGQAGYAKTPTFTLPNPPAHQNAADLQTLLPKKPGPFEADMLPICRERDAKYGSWQPTDPAVGPIFNNLNHEEEQASRFLLNSQTEMTLSKLYFRSGGSSRKAKKIVSDVLEQHGCNGELVNNVDMKTWIKPVGSSSSYEAVGLHQMVLNSSNANVYGGGQIKYAKTLDLLKQSLGLKDEDIQAKAALWKGYEFSGACATTMSEIDAICSGEKTAESEFQGLLAKVDPALAKGGPLAGEFESALNLSDTLRSRYLRSEYYKLEEQKHKMDVANPGLKNSPNVITNKESGIPHDYTGPVMRASQTADEKKYEDIQNKMDEIQKEHTIINNQKIEPLIADEKPKGTKEEVAFEIGLAEYINGPWATKQRGLSKAYSNCRRDMSSPQAKTTLDHEPINGSCNIDAALNDLAKINSENSNLDPGLIIEPTTNPNEKWKAAMIGMPDCSQAWDDVELARCEKSLDQHFIKHGFDDGVDEACLSVNVYSVCNRPSVMLKKYDHLLNPKKDTNSTPVSEAYDLEDFKFALPDPILETPEPKFDPLKPTPKDLYCYAHPFDYENCEERYRAFYFAFGALKR